MDILRMLSRKFGANKPDTPEYAVPEEITKESLSEILLSEVPSAVFYKLFRSGRLGESLPELEECARITARDRRKSLLDHSLRVCDVIKPRLHLRLAGLLHDIGKPHTASVDNGEIHFYKHDEIGAAMARGLLERMGFDGGLSDRVALLIKNHMFQLNGFHSDKAIGRFIRKVGRDNVFDLLELRRADIVGSSEGYWAGWENLRLLRDRMNEILTGDDGAGGPALPLTGRDVQEILGIAPGPAVGRILKRLRNLVEADPAMADAGKLTQALTDPADPYGLKAEL